MTRGDEYQTRDNNEASASSYPRDAYGYRLGYEKDGVQNESGFTETGKLNDRKEWKAHRKRVRAGDVLFHPNYNDDPDPAVIETVERLVDTNKVIELERIDLKALPKRRVFRFVKRAFDIGSCSVALVVCAIPMVVIAIAVKLDSPGPVFYVQERLGWSIIGQKSGAASGYPFRPALSALGAPSESHPRARLGVVA